MKFIPLTLKDAFVGYFFDLFGYFSNIENTQPESFREHVRPSGHCLLHLNRRQHSSYSASNNLMSSAVNFR